MTSVPSRRYSTGQAADISQAAAMGSDADSPLDEKLRVRGVENLRVADAYALPQIPRTNTNAPSIMIGERCADFLLTRSARPPAAADNYMRHRPIV